MRRTVQTRLTDFDESTKDKKKKQDASDRLRLPTGELWEKTVSKRKEWGVCNFDGTVLLVRLVGGRIHAHGREAVCKWCEGALVIRDEKVFCEGPCEKYQGEFSRDLSAYLWWEGAKSYTLRKRVAEIEDLELQQRDIEPITYAPHWSVLEEYEEDPD
ncbi:MAG: hypothetical protein ACXABV_10395 [Candidatus Thorarchaeota archaeon]|jgi:hypothetical protein